MAKLISNVEDEYVYLRLINHKLNNMEDQIRLFEIVKSIIPNNLTLIDEMEDLLGLSKESTYRRVRGEKILSFAEWKKICEKYHLSIDEIINSKSEKGSLFQYKPVNISDIESYVACLKRLFNFMDVVASSPLEKRLVFSALNIPFYHFCKYPELAFFKLFIWNDTQNTNSISFISFKNINQFL